MERSKIPSVNLKLCKISAEVLQLVPAELMKKYSFIPFDYSGEKLSIAVANPQDTATVDDIRITTGYDLDVFYSSKDDIWLRLRDMNPELYKQADAKELAVDRFVPNGSKLSPQAPQNFLAEETTVSKIMDEILNLAVQRGASDIHLEPQEDFLHVRLRVDGILTTVYKYSKLIQPPLISRVKVLANMDITERRLPQDNQFSMRVRHNNIDLRVSTIPGKFGEKVVIRVLDKSHFALDIAQLGISPSMLTAFEQMIQKPQGMLLVTGPTGSGKTTTLYSVLNRLISPQKNIVTLEDPIEYELLSGKPGESGITQVAINSKIGMTFAAGLRAALRQDPDIIMVGEIRDKETAEIAMKSALTGHLVLSTLHTNNAFSTVLRLKDMGVEPYLIGSTVVGIMAQRLVRVLCPHCKEPYKPPLRALKTLFPNSNAAAHGVTLYRAKGCEKCQQLGYRGRKGIYELLSVTDDLVDLIQNQSHPSPSNEIVRSCILKTLRQSGLELVEKGETTVEEIFRTTVE